MKFVSKTIFGLLVVFFMSCTSTSSGSGGIYRPISLNDTVIGSVQGTIVTSNWDRMWGASNVTESIKEQAYSFLLGEAKKTYQGAIDIKNIMVVYNKFENGQAFYNATGNVVTVAGSNVATMATGVEGALARAAEETLKNVPRRSRIAIVYITAQDRSTTEYIVGELEYIWVNEGYFITDRSQLDRLRREQNFQMSGEVDDATAVSIGKFAGADIIVTGRVDGEGNLRRLRLRALNTETAQVVGVASERL